MPATTTRKPSTRRKHPTKKPEAVAAVAPPDQPAKPWRKLLKLYFVIPALIYFAFFCFYTWPWISNFNVGFFTDSGDGFQNVWNLWWVNESVTKLHQLPWHTTFLHYPYGTTLVSQTMNSFNGFVGILLLTVFSLVQVYNIMVIFSFVVGGLTAFWLCYEFSRKYVPSLIGGFIFTFSTYHFAHAIGHMQLVSLEWLPLFLLLWWWLITRPRYRTAVAAAVVLLLVLLCDYYYFMYSVSTAALMLLYAWRQKKLAPITLPQTYRPFILFCLLALIMAAPLPLTLFLQNAHDPLLGSHDSRVYSADLLNYFITGEFWRFASLTGAYWRYVPAYWAEASIYLTVAVLVLLGIALAKRTKINKNIGLWMLVGGIFGILSLGPRLSLRGNSIERIPLPYGALEHVIPNLKLSGAPVRMSLMVILASAVISAMVLARLDMTQRRGKILTGAFCLLLFFELWPGPLPLTRPTMAPQYVSALAKLPPGGVVDDAAITGTWALYDQTVTGKPQAFGYLTRTPTSVQEKSTPLSETIQKKQYDQLCSRYKIRYFTSPATRPLQTDLPLIYNDHQNLIYDLKNSPAC